MLLLQIEVNKGKDAILVCFLYSESKMIAIHARGWGGGYSLEFEVRCHVLLLLYCVVNFIRETSASGT